MPLQLFPNVYATGALPKGWKPNKGDTRKYPVRNRKVRTALRQMLPGRWQKVIKKGNLGEIHFFEHSSGAVANVKYFAKTVLP